MIESEARYKNCLERFINKYREWMPYKLQSECHHQHPTFYRPDALSVALQCQSTEEEIFVYVEIYSY